MKTPSTTSQAPEKFHTPGTKAIGKWQVEVWSLKFLWMLEPGIWSFLFRA